MIIKSPLLFIFAATFLISSGYATADEMFEQADSDGNGAIDTEEFRTHMVDTFFLADDDRDGLLKGEELKIVNQERLAEADKDSDGDLDLTEFLNSTSFDFDVSDTDHDDMLGPDEL